MHSGAPGPQGGSKADSDQSVSTPGLKYRVTSALAGLWKRGRIVNISVRVGTPFRPHFRERVELGSL